MLRQDSVAVDAGLAGRHADVAGDAAVGRAERRDVDLPEMEREVGGVLRVELRAVRPAGAAIRAIISRYAAVARSTSVPRLVRRRSLLRRTVRPSVFPASRRATSSPSWARGSDPDDGEDDEAAEKQVKSASAGARRVPAFNAPDGVERVDRRQMVRSGT
jgi:hypothetical protein